MFYVGKLNCLENMDLVTSDVNQTQNPTTEKHNYSQAWGWQCNLVGVTLWLQDQGDLP